MFETLKRAVGFVRGRARRRWVGVFTLAVLVSFVEAIGALLIYSVVGAIAEPDKAFDLPVLGDLRDRFPGSSEATLFRYAAIAIAVFFVVRGALVLTQIYVQHRVAYRTGVTLAGRLVDGYLHLPFADHLRRNSAEMIRTANESVNQVVVYVFAPSVLLLSEALVVLALLVVLVFAAPLATVLVMTILAVVILVLLRVIQPRLVRLGEANQEMYRRSLQSIQQSLQGIRDIKILGREDFFRREYVGSATQLARTQYVRSTLIETPRIAVETIVLVLLLVFLAVKGTGTAASDGSLALLGLFAYAALRLMPSLNRVVTNVNYLRFGGAATKLVADDLAIVAAVGDTGGVGAGLELRDRIALEGVSFRYEDTDEDAVSGIDLEIRAGESIGVVGSTGGGKTTLVDVLLGLLVPTEGTVRVDGIDLRGREPAWHRSLGVVPQMPFLVDDTLRHNIALGLDDDQIDDGAVTDAMRLAQIEDFVNGLPRGWDTVVGERGVRLSGGQRQRVAIARALYRRPTVLVFDEGTSALDNLTEAELIRALEALRGDHTIVTVAHRLTTVRRCDRIVMIEGGRIADIGSYEGLRDSNAAFRRMAG